MQNFAAQVRSFMEDVQVAYIYIFKGLKVSMFGERNSVTL